MLERRRRQAPPHWCLLATKRARVSSEISKKKTDALEKGGGGEREKRNSRRKYNKKRGMSRVKKDEKVLPACRRLLKTICRVIFLVFSLSPLFSFFFFGGPRQVLLLGLWRNEKPTQAKTHIYVGKGKRKVEKSDRLYFLFSITLVFFLSCLPSVDPPLHIVFNCLLGVKKREITHTKKERY